MAMKCDILKQYQEDCTNYQFVASQLQIHPFCLVCENEHGPFQFFSIASCTMFIFVSRGQWRNMEGRKGFLSGWVCSLGRSYSFWLFQHQTIDSMRGFSSLRLQQHLQCLPPAVHSSQGYSDSRSFPSRLLQEGLLLSASDESSPCEHFPQYGEG